MRGVRQAAKDRFDGFPTKLIRGTDINRYGLQYIMIDELNKLLTLDGPVILNHDRSSGSGTHWTMLYLQRHPTPILYYYDPLGPKVSPVPRELREFSTKYVVPLVVNPYSHQYVKSNLCGYYAIFAAKVVKEILKMGELTPRLFTRIMYALHGGSPDRKDVERLVRLF